MRRWLHRLLFAGTLLLALLLIAGGLLWSDRNALAGGFVDRALAKRGVRASFRVASIGWRTQRVERLVVGDPALPDLTAAAAEVTIGIGLHGPAVTGVRLEHPRLRARWADGRLRLGELDKLLPAPSGGAASLPDLVADVVDGRVRIDSPAGRIGMAVEGQGNLRSGFMGRAALVSPQLTAGGCTAIASRALFNLSSHAGRPAIDGPVRAQALLCRGMAIDAPEVALDLRLRPTLDGGRGGARITAAQLVARGAASGGLAARGLVVQVGFDGDAKAVAGHLELAVALAGNPDFGLKTVAFDGRYQAGIAAGRYAVAGDMAGRIAINPVTARRYTAGAAAAAGTPVGPLAAALAGAAERATRRAHFTGRIGVQAAGGAATLRIGPLAMRAESGARLQLAGAGGFGIDWPSGLVRSDGRLRLAGGGLPGVDLLLAQPQAGAPVTGRAAVAPFAAGGARAALAPVRFGPDGRGGTRVVTALRLDGPLADGRVSGLDLPIAGRIDGRGGFRFGEGCLPVGFDRLAIAGIALANGRTLMCPLAGPAILFRAPGGAIDGGVRTGAIGFAGRLGATPVTLATGTLRIPFRHPGFVAERVAVQLGAGADPTRLAIARLAGDVRPGGIAGTLAGAVGKIANVPLAIADGAGDWRLAGGALDLDAAMAVSDTVAPVRFRPLTATGVHLAFRDGAITATGRLETPAGAVHVADVDIRHTLADGSGRALLAVPGIAFGDALQPEALTPLTLGIVANVEGTVAGSGTIRWDGRGVTSSGRFSTAALDLAAAFGPVKGIAGTIVFSDLLGLQTAPGQQVTIAEINPGVAVTGGTVSYQLLPGRLIRIEGGRWPFAGGALTLDPTTLDFAERRERHLTFNVDGLDAAQFIEQLELKNIAVTGRFDGVLPMIFDDTGGRIEGGRLAVREGGGTLAYVGDISNQQLGLFGKLAFDALKSIRYRSLAIDLNGALDGEIVSRVSFDGTNESPRNPKRSGWLGQLTGLPFRFRITVTAPFRQLMNAATSFNDPRGLIGDQLPKPAVPPTAPAPATPPAAPIQRPESRTMR